jgi:hypothetical protein
MSGTKYINVEGRGVKWHLMLKGVVCVANRINGSKDGLSPVEWDDIQRYGVIRELRVEVFEPVGGETIEDGGGLDDSQSSPTRISPSTLHSLPSCRRPQFAHDLGRGVKAGEVRN